MGVKVRLRALAIRALEAGPGRIVLTLGETATLDPFKLAKHVQGSSGRLKLTPDMKLVALTGTPPPRPARPAKAKVPPRGAARDAAVRAAVAALTATQTPAQEAAAGRELLDAARAVLTELAACARDA
jgi:transcription-repair coupling factor (superfamily II helicase)